MRNVYYDETFGFPKGFFLVLILIFALILPCVNLSFLFLQPAGWKTKSPPVAGLLLLLL